MKLRDMWRRIVVRRYTGQLEIEVMRLRGEDRALLNSILGIAGVPLIAVNVDDRSLGHLELGLRTVAAAKVPVPTVTEHDAKAAGGIQKAMLVASGLSEAGDQFSSKKRNGVVCG